MLLPQPTARIEFRRWHEDDRALAEALWCDPEVMAHMGGPLTAAGARARLTAQVAMERGRGVQYWPMVLRETVEFAGCCGLRPWMEAPGSTELLEIGCHLMRAGWGARLGEEACRGVLAHGFDELGLTTIVAGHSVSNAHSRSLTGRLGFRYTHQSWYEPAGLEVRWYALTATEWRALEVLAATEGV